MKSIPGYQIIETIHEGRRSRVFRGLRIEDELPVIVKACPNNFPSTSNLNRLQREFRIGQEIDHKNIIKYFALEKTEHGLAIIGEDFGAVSLACLISENALAPLLFLEIAIQLADSLGAIHHLDIVHKDINPRNIVINVETNQVKLIDFGLSSHLREEPSFHTHLANIEGTFAYISPEQTGRMNRGIDFRTDFYSLGVTFYELLTGSPPFHKKEPLELVYCHIAKPPTPPCEIDSEIPEPISDIVMKLLEKNAEDRYQSGYGLKADLEECYRQIKYGGKIEDLSAGQSDVSENFHIHQKLYGREKEIDQILEAFDHVSNGRVKSVLTLVSGYSGIGKSSLIHEVYKPLARESGYFISGKFDQFRRDIPYASIIEAFQQLIKLILTESSEKIAAWKEQVLEGVGLNAQVIIDVIPEVEHVVGPQPPVQELGAVENRNRFNRVFLNFTRVFAKKNHPLVIFLDDLQWADPPTFHLIELMLVDPDCEHLFFIGAYRDNEVNDSHPLIKTLKDIQKKRPIRNLSLKPLELGHVESLISDSFNCSNEQARSLAEITEQKTRGNPFFIKMFLKTLYQEKLLYFHPEKGVWLWDMHRIMEMGITDNVVDFMVGRLEKLPAETTRILSVASLIGNQFDLKLLSPVEEIPLPGIAEAIWPAVEEGLILPMGEKFNWVKHNWESDLTVMFKFLHDRVQQAADVLLPENDKIALHLTIGRIYRKLTEGKDLAENVFTIVNHLNKGRSLIADPRELLELAQFNLMAARKAKLSSAYEPALNYVTTGMKLLPQNNWKENYEFTFSYYVEKGELLYLNSRWDEAIETFDIALDRAQTLVDRCKINSYKANLYRMKNDLKAALNTGLDALAELDIHLKPFPDQEEVREEIDRVQSLMAAKGMDNLYDLPELSDPLKLAALGLLTACFAPAYFLGSRLISIIGARMSEITIEHGNSPHAVTGYIFYSAISLAVDLRDFDNAYELGLVALKLNDEKYHKQANEALLLDMWGTFVCHHKEPINNAREHLMRGYFSGVENGSYQWAGYCAMINLFMSFWGTDSLKKISDKIDKILPGLEKIDPNMAQYYYAVKAATHNLTKPVEDVTTLSQSVWPNIIEVIEVSEEQDDLLTLLVETTCRLSLANWYGKRDEAMPLAARGERYAEGVPGVFINPVFYFHQALAYAGGYENATPAEKEKCLNRIQKTLSIFEHYAAHCPPNYRHQALLIKAELAKITGNILEAMDSYDQAIESAQENGFYQNEAFANELAARFYLSINKEKIALPFLREAHYTYKVWGAKAKLIHFEETYSHLPLFSSVTGAQTRINSLAGTVTETTSLVPLDLKSVMKSSQAISMEMDFSDLLESMMKIILENAGAEKGYLILEETDQLRIRAHTQKSSDIIAIPSSLTLNQCDDIPKSIVHYVIRSRENVILYNACEEGMYTADPYIASNQSKSILCMPIKHKGGISGALFLENTLTTFAFTEDRVRVLEVLLGQAAISLENAKLYSETTALNQNLEQEIESHKQTHSALRKSEEMHRSILNNALDGIITIDEKGIIQAFNPAAATLFGWKASEAIGRNISMLMPSPYADEHDDYLRNYMETGISKIMGAPREVPARHRNGSIFYIEISVSEMVLEGQHLFVGIVRDISDRKKVEDKLKHYAFDLEKANEELKSFTYTASHDLQEPLRKVIIFGDRLQASCSDRLEAKEIDYIERMQKAAFRMKDLIEDLLRYSRFSHEDLNFEPLNLNEIVQEVIADLEVLIESAAGNIQLFNLPTIEANKIQMRQLFQNIISNGLKYKTPGTPSKIVIQSSSNKNNQHVISIQDNGVGIEEKYHDKIFQPFKRLHSDKDIKGTGMGLFICQKIVTSHNGTISVESQPKKGATFIFTLPEKPSKQG